MVRNKGPPRDMCSGAGHTGLRGVHGAEVPRLHGGATQGCPRPEAASHFIPFHAVQCLQRWPVAVTEKAVTTGNSAQNETVGWAVDRPGRWAQQELLGCSSGNKNGL